MGKPVCILASARGSRTNTVIVMIIYNKKGAVIDLKTDEYPKVNAAIQKLSKVSVMVGIPSDTEQPHLGTGQVGTDARQGKGNITNAVLAYTHEFGSPAANIPARPFIVPGVQAAQPRITSYFQQAGDFALKGNEGGMMRAFHAAGLYAVTSIKTTIQARIPPPLAPATVAARIRKNPNRKRTAQGQNLGPNDFTPLIDSAQLVNSISYIVRTK